MKKTLTTIGAVALISGVAYLANNTSSLPAPNTISMTWDYADTNCLGWINIGIDRTTNLIDWETVYIWSNTVATNYTFIDGKSNQLAFYRTWVNWTNAEAETNESMRPQSYRNL